MTARRSLPWILWSVVAASGLVACGTQASDLDDTDTGGGADAGSDAGTDTGGPPPSACEGPDPRGCIVNGCPDGLECQLANNRGCQPSMCSCDEATGTWGCTADCGPTYTCQPPVRGLCDTPDPRGCRATGCDAGSSCVPTGDPGCMPSSCGCDDEAGWVCTEDCLEVVACQPDETLQPPSACEGERPNACTEIGCPYGQVCMVMGEPGCMASQCECSGEGEWVCTDDCGPVVACVSVEPDASPCAEPNPAGCSVTGCPRGEACVPAATDGCRPSSCVCDAESGLWACTRDCAQQMICRPREAGDGSCQGTNPAGCAVTGCPDGQTCVPSDDDGCRPGSCTCDHEQGGWLCSLDCWPMMECVTD